MEGSIRYFLIEIDLFCFRDAHEFADYWSDPTLTGSEPKAEKPKSQELQYWMKLYVEVAIHVSVERLDLLAVRHGLSHVIQQEAGLEVDEKTDPS